MTLIDCGPTLIYLIGYRGSGKTATAKLLAERLQWNWLDADARLEQHYRRTIKSIFAEEGEARFRDKESAILQQIAPLNQYVVATGGGIILREENRDLLRNGVVVWLQASAETLWQRINNDQTTGERRPNLASGGLQEVREMLAKREQLYRHCADVAFSTEDDEPCVVAEKIADYLAAQNG